MAYNRSTLSIWSCAIWLLPSTCCWSKPVAETVGFCDLASQPERFQNRLLEVEAAETSTIDEKTRILFDPKCKIPITLVLDEENHRALENFYSYRAPEKITEGPFWIWGKFRGKIVRSNPVISHYVDDSGFHFVAISVEGVEARSIAP